MSTIWRWWHLSDKSTKVFVWDATSDFFKFIFYLGISTTSQMGYIFPAALLTITVALSTKCHHPCSQLEKNLCSTDKNKPLGAENNRGKRTDRLKSSIQTRLVTNREFYELQTCWNGVQCVCGGSYRLAGSRGGWERPHLRFVKMVWFIFRMRGSHWGGIRPVSPPRFMDH